MREERIGRWDCGRTWTLLVLSLSILLPGAPASGNDASAGTTGAEFLKIENGVRPISMGGAYTALARDVPGGLYWNPAGLGYLKANEASASYNAFYQDIVQGYAAYGHGFEDLGGLAVGLSYMSAGRQVQTEGNPNGGYTILGSFTPSAWVMSAGYGLSFMDDRVSAGAVFKHIDESFWANSQDRSNPDDTSSSVAMDVGLMARLFDGRLAFGAAYQNLGSPMRGYSLPALLRTGLSWESGPFSASLDVLMPSDDDMGYRAGVEYVILKTLSLRAGYNSTLNRNNSGSPGALNAGLATGIGLQVAGIGFDYGFVPYGDMGYSHRIGLSYRWGQTPPEGRRPAGGPQPSHTTGGTPAQGAATQCPKEAEISTLRLSADQEAARQKFLRADQLIAHGDYA